MKHNIISKIYSGYFIQAYQNDTIFRIAKVLSTDNFGNKLFECEGPFYDDFFSASNALTKLVKILIDNEEKLCNSIKETKAS